jgi:hypothetical protein
MQIGLITVDGRQIGVVSLTEGDDIDTFAPDLDGYVPMGRAADNSVSAPVGGSAPHHAGRNVSHGGAAHVSDRAHHHTSREGYTPRGETYSGAGGHPVRRGSAEVDQAIVDAARAHHLDVNTMRSIASIESDNNPSSNANRSTQYKGLYQIGRDEWRRFGEGNIYSAHDNAMAAARMFEANRNQFRAHYHRDPTDAELYMMHQQGLGFYTRGAMTNVRGNPYPGMHGPQSHETFEAGWGRELARRKERFSGQSAPATAAPSASPAGSGKANDALNWMKQREGLQENRDRSELRSDMGGFDPATEAWCAQFVNSALRNAGIKGSGSAVANSFQRWGNRVGPGDVKAGDVAVIDWHNRGPDQVGGHVGMATGATRAGPNGKQQFEMEAGNDANMVRRTWHNVDDPRIHFRRAPSDGGDKKVAEKPFDPETMVP